MNFELSGRLIEKFDEVQINDRFKKREFVIEKTEANGFTEQIKFQLVQDKTNLIESFGINDELKVSFNIKGNKWKDNYFVNLQAWKIESDSAGSSSGANMPPPPSINDAPMESDNPEDDLPF